MNWRIFGIVFVVLTIVFVGTTAYFATKPPVEITKTVTAPGGTVTTTIERTITTTVGVVTGKPLRIALLLMGGALPYWDIWIQGVKDAVDDLKALGIPASYTYFDGKYDPKIQSDQVLTAIGKYEAIILTPVDRVGLQPAVEEAMKAGVIVIIADNSVERRELMTPFIGSSHLKGAELEAQALIQCLRNSGKTPPWKLAVIHGVTSAAANVLRLQGFYNVLGPFIKNGTIKVVDVQCGEDRTDKAYSVMLSILAKQKVDAVIATNDEQAIGAIKAVEVSGLKPGVDVIVAGFNAIPEAVEAIKAGKMYASIAQAPYMMGYWSTLIAFFKYYFNVDVVKQAGGKNWIPTPIIVVTKENVDTFEVLVKSKSLPPLPSDDTSSIVLPSDVTALIESFKK